MESCISDGVALTMLDRHSSVVVKKFKTLPVMLRCDHKCHSKPVLIKDVGLLFKSQGHPTDHFLENSVTPWGTPNLHPGP